MENFLHDQTFQWFDLLVLFVVIITEILFSADNMLILGLIIKKVPKHQHSLVIWIGLLGSVVLRMLAIFLVAYLIHLTLFQALGGIYLIYLALNELLSKKKSLTQAPITHSLLKAICYILFIDLIFSLDSILAAFAIVGISPIEGDASPKLWIVVLGASFGILILRAAISRIIIWLERKPILERLTLIFVFWIGLRLTVESILSTLQLDFGYDMLALHKLVKWMFWAISLLFFLYAGIELTRKPKKIPF
ncbi:MAG: TerC family protein [Chlamydiia bacterium]